METVAMVEPERSTAHSGLNRFLQQSTVRSHETSHTAPAISASSSSSSLLSPSPEQAWPAFDEESMVFSGSNGSEEKSKAELGHEKSNHDEDRKNTYGHNGSSCSCSCSSSSSSSSSSKLHLMEALISNLFSAISSLRSAIMQLRLVNSPPDSESSQLAHEAVIAELNRLIELQQTYGARLASISSSSHGMQNEEAQEEEQQDAANPEPGKSAQDQIVESFRAQIRSKDGVIQELKDVLGRSTLEREKLGKKVKRLEERLLLLSPSGLRASSGDRGASSLDSQRGPSPWLLESAVLGASEASKNFAKLLISSMKAARWNLESAADSIEPSISYMRGSHRKFAFESYISRRMLNNFEREDLGIYAKNNNNDDDDDDDDYDNRSSCYLSQEASFEEFEECRVRDPLEMVRAKPKCDFSKYCLRRFLELIHPKMEESFFGSLEHREQVRNGIHPRTQFYRSFMELARSMWMLHKLAFSFRPKRARIFEVRKGMEFSPLYMESIVQMLDIGVMGSNPGVAFTVMPGFRIHNTIIKCQVYLLPCPTKDDAKTP